MPYAEIYSHNQQQRGMTSGQDQQLGLTQSAKVDKGIGLKGVVGVMVVAKQIQPVLRQGLTSFLQSSGDAKLKQNIAVLGTIITTGISVATLGLPAVAIAAVAVTAKQISRIVDEHHLNVEQDYNVKVRGAKANFYASGGNFYD